MAVQQIKCKNSQGLPQKSQDKNWRHMVELGKKENEGKKQSLLLD